MREDDVFRIIFLALDYKTRQKYGKKYAWNVNAHWRAISFWAGTIGIIANDLLEYGNCHLASINRWKLLRMISWHLLLTAWLENGRKLHPFILEFKEIKLRLSETCGTVKILPINVYIQIVFLLHMKEKPPKHWS